MDILKLLQIAFKDQDLVSTVDETSFFQSFVRSFRYYGGDTGQENQERIGNSLHSDWNLLTLVWTDQPGLEVLYKGNYSNVEC